LIFFYNPKLHSHAKMLHAPTKNQPTKIEEPLEIIVGHIEGIGNPVTVLSISEKHLTN
jgi:hypothetical protein